MMGNVSFINAGAAEWNKQQSVANSYHQGGVEATSFKKKKKFKQRLLENVSKKVGVDVSPAMNVKQLAPSCCGEDSRIEHQDHDKMIMS